MIIELRRISDANMDFCTTPLPHEKNWNSVNMIFSIDVKSL